MINIDGYYGRQAAKAKMEAFQLQTERTKEYLELEINKAYMQLQLAYKEGGYCFEQSQHHGSFQFASRK